MKTWISALAAVALASSASAQAPPPLKPELAGLGFMLGHWSSPQRSTVQDTGGSGQGVSAITSEVGGGAILRRDHTELFDAAGKPAGGFDILMMIYPEAGAIHADYADGAHVIHYTSADVVPGKSATFSSAAPPGAPSFRLTYTLTTPTTMSIAFRMTPPGGGPFRPIATGVVKRDD